MKKLFYAVALLLSMSVSVSTFAQSLEDVYLGKAKAKMIQKQQLAEIQHGSHYGLTLSLTPFVSAEKSEEAKFGVFGFYGHRFSEHWMVTGYAGIDISPSYVHEGFVDSVTYPTAVSVPIIAEGRFYFGSARFMPFIFLDYGVAISKYTGTLFNAGFGSDLNLFGKHTIFSTLGIGMSPHVWLNPNSEFVGTSEFALNIRIGYYF